MLLLVRLDFFLLLCLFGTVIFSHQAMSASIYKCKQANGHVTFTSLPCPKSTVKREYKGEIHNSKGGGTNNLRQLKEQIKVLETMNRQNRKDDYQDRAARVERERYSKLIRGSSLGNAEKLKKCKDSISSYTGRSWGSKNRQLSNSQIRARAERSEKIRLRREAEIEKKCGKYMNKSSVAKKNHKNAHLSAIKSANEHARKDTAKALEEEEMRQVRQAEERNRQAEERNRQAEERNRVELRLRHERKLERIGVWGHEQRLKQAIRDCETTSMANCRR